VGNGSLVCSLVLIGFVGQGWLWYKLMMYGLWSMGCLQEMSIIKLGKENFILK